MMVFLETGGSGTRGGESASLAPISRYPALGTDWMAKGAETHPDWGDLRCFGISGSCTDYLAGKGQ